MNFPQPLVLIFGAGATRGGLEGKANPPLPIDMDFFDIAMQLRGHGTSAVARRVQRSVWNLYRKSTGVSLEKYYRDIETRAKIAEFAQTANRPKDWNSKRQDLEELIRRVYIHTTCDTSKQPIKNLESKLHENILEYLREGDTVITFNTTC